jgi:hypothetical protein
VAVVTSRSAATLRSRYVEQAESDLKENRRRQQELTESIKLLEQEEALLVDILAVAERYEVSSDPVRLPEQAQDEPVLTPSEPAADVTPATTRATPRRTTSSKTTGTRAGKNTAKPVATEESPQPLLGDLLCDLLSAYDEPRYAKELRDELLEKYPDRNPTAQVVRNTLETLVARGRIQRHKQQRSVLYTIA